MSPQVTTIEHPTYLHFKVTGLNEPDVVRAYLAQVLQQCIQRGARNALIEEHLEGPPLDSLAIYDVASQGSAAARAHFDRIAFVDTNPAHPARNHNLAESVARNFRLNIRSFRTLAEAQEWISAAESLPAARLTPPPLPASLSH